MEPEFVHYHRYIAFSLSRDLRHCESLRPKSASVSIPQETQDRPTISSAKRLAGALYIDKNKQSKSFFHRHSRLLGTSHRHCKRAGLIKRVDRSPGPPIYQALMLNASSVGSIRETVCIASSSGNTRKRAPAGVCVRYWERPTLPVQTAQHVNDTVKRRQYHGQTRGRKVCGNRCRYRFSSAVLLRVRV